MSVSSADEKQQPQPPAPQAFPPLGRMVAWVPSKANQLPAVTHTGHRKFRVHLHGFHRAAAKDFPWSPESLTFPADGERTAEIFAYREEKHKWTQSTKAEKQVFADLEDSDAVLLTALGPDPRGVFAKAGDWGVQGHCQFGDCLYAVIMAYVPRDAFRKGASAKPM